MYQENEIVKEILKIIQSFKDGKVDLDNGDLISRAAVRLNVLRAYLGELTAKVTMDYNEKYSYRKFTFAKDYKAIRSRIDSKIKDAEMEAGIMAIDNTSDEIQAQYQADLFKSLEESCTSLAGVLQSRLRYLISERSSSSN